MNLSKKYGTKIVKSMFNNYDFEFTIDTPDDDLVYFDIVTQGDCLNNTISLSLAKSFDKDLIKVYVYKISEDYELIGWYNIKNNEFIKSDNFWEVMFSEHLMI